MPTFVFHIPVDLHELFQDSGAASCTFRCKARRVMEMAVNIALMLVIGILWPEKNGTQ